MFESRDNLEKNEEKVDETLFKEKDLNDPSEQVSNQLPGTVTLLEAENGVKVYLVGTAHFSKESQIDVKKTIELVQPKVVMLELCASRTSILSLDEDTLLKEAGEMNFQKLSTSVKQHGMVQGLLQILMLNMSAHLTKKLGMAPGGEFRTAFHEGQKIPGCTIQLGDRPIRITLRRALNSLTFYQKLKLAFSLLFFNGSISAEDVEKCKQRDMLEELLVEMTGEFPSLSKVFVEERDIYLAYSLKRAAELASYNNSCEGCDYCDCDDEPWKDDDGYEKLPENEEKEHCCDEKGCKSTVKKELAVVGVVGIGHCPGICKVWNQHHDINSVLTVPPASKFSYVLRLFVRMSLLGILGWGCYKAGLFVYNLII